MDTSTGNELAGYANDCAGKARKPVSGRLDNKNTLRRADLDESNSLVENRILAGGWEVEALS